MLEPYYCITCLYQKQFYVGLVYIRVAAGAESPVSVPPAMYPAEYPAAAAAAASFSVPVAPVVPSAAVGWWGRGWVVGYPSASLSWLRFAAVPPAVHEGGIVVGVHDAPP